MINLSLDEAIRHFGDLAKRLEVEAAKEAKVADVWHFAMIKACVLVQSEAILELGHYQPATGPYPAWPQLAPSTQTERTRLGYEPNAPLYRDGTLARSIEFTIEGNTGYVGTNNPYAAYLELGTSTIPPRSFLASAAFRKEYEVHRIFAKAIWEEIKATR